MAKYTLISFKLCPYVQRVAIALAEKGVPFDLVYIDLADKPDWFNAISPLGKVPLLKVEEGDQSTVLFESSVILEFLEDSDLGEPLHPAEPLVRARNRAWMEYGSTLLGDIWALEIAADRAAHEAAMTRIVSRLGGLERTLTQEPYFNGERFGFVDAVFAPAFRYFDVFDRYMQQSLLASFPKVSRWRAELAQRPSVAAAVVPEYAALLEAFLQQKQTFLLRAPRESASFDQPVRGNAA